MNRLAPAIIRTEQRTIQSLAQCCANGLTATVAQAETWLAHHDELHDRYKENWATWEAACQAVYKMSRQAIHKRIAKITERISCDPSTEVDETADSYKQTEEVALNKIEKAREVAPEPEQEEEKPTVHSADEPKPHTNGHANPTQSGKPKSQLAIWNEMEFSLLGRALNRTDELNRQSPNVVHHKRLITTLKMCLGILDEWKRDTK